MLKPLTETAGSFPLPLQTMNLPTTTEFSACALPGRVSAKFA